MEGDIFQLREIKGWANMFQKLCSAGTMQVDCIDYSYRCA